MAEILYGAPVREKIKTELIERVKNLGRMPVLQIISVGDRPDSMLYIKNKMTFGSSIGVDVWREHLAADAECEEVAHELEIVEAQKNIDAVILQLPLPEEIIPCTDMLLEMIPKQKDADGLAPNSPMTPATARGVGELLAFYNIEVKNKKVTVVGRSRLAGGSIAKLLESLGGEVTVCHRGTPQEDLPRLCREADILVVAAGKEGLITKEFVREGQVVIDVGINRSTVTGKVVGDVLFEEVAPIVQAITPVPGGVGVLTVAALFQNVLDLCYNRP